MCTLVYYFLDEDIVHLASTIYLDHSLTVVVSHPEIVTLLFQDIKHGTALSKQMDLVDSHNHMDKH